MYERKRKPRLSEARNQLREDEDLFIDLDLGDQISVEMDDDVVEGEIDRFTDNGFVLLSHQLSMELSTYDIIDIEGAAFVVARVGDGWVELAVTDDPDAGYWVAAEPWEYDMDAPLDEATRVRRRFKKTQSGGYRRRVTKRATPGERRRAKKYYRRHRAAIKRRRKIRKRRPEFKRSQRRLSRAQKSQKKD